MFDVGESWAVGIAEVGGGPVSVRANLAVTRAAPYPSHPLHLIVRVMLNHPTEGGWPTASEAAELSVIEDRIEGSLARPALARLCTSVTPAEGHRDFGFQAVEGDWVEPWAHRSREQNHSHHLRFSWKLDADWSQVRWWAKRAVEADGDRRVIAALVDSGIDLEVPRTIEYVLRFPDEVVARAAAGELIDHDYEAAVDASDGRWVVVASHEERPTQKIIALMRSMLTSFCDERGGTFDGWGVPIDAPAKRRRGRR